MGLTILADENIPGLDSALEGLGRVSLVNGRTLSREQLDGVDALLVRSVTRVDHKLLEGSGVAFVGTATSGVDHVDREYLRRAGIGFAHAPGSNANSVVEYVLAAIAATADKLQRLREGAVLGIVGYGHIGRALTARLRALTIDYLVYDPWLDPQTVSRPASLAQVLDCEVVSLHAELTREQPWPSFHLLGEDELALIPDGALLINASRGAVLDNAALLRHLSRGSALVTALDVWEAEPSINRELLQRVNLATPHIAGYSLDGKLLATRMLAQALATSLDLRLPQAATEAEGPPPVELEHPRTGTDLLRQLLSARYRIEDDDARLRAATLGCEEAAAAVAFDRLRRDYPVRRELLGSAVRTTLPSDADAKLLEALGCRLLPPGK